MHSLQKTSGGPVSDDGSPQNQELLLGHSVQPVGKELKFSTSCLEFGRMFDKPDQLFPK